MTKFHVGNVIRNPHGHLEIVTDVHWGVPGKSDYVRTVSFDAQNSSGGGDIDDVTTEESCGCWLNYDMESGEADPDCSDCHGTKRWNRFRPGYNRATVLAPCVRDFIIRRLMKNFNID